MLRKYFFPKESATSVHAIDYAKLWQNGIRGLIFDIDNTLVTFDIAKPTDKVIQLFEKLSAMGFVICLLSNNNEERVKYFCGNLSHPYIWKAKKPGRKSIARALALLSLSKNQVAIIGDQIFTDCLGGNLFGIHTILTTPIAKRDEWTVRLKRWPEKPILRAYARSIRKSEDRRQKTGQ